MFDSQILYRALKISEEIYDEAMYGDNDLYRIKDLSHALDTNHWVSKRWLVERLADHYKFEAGSALIVGGWYGLTAFLMRQQWKESCMLIESSDMDPKCAHYGWKLFPHYNINFTTLDVNSKPDLSSYSIIINTSCEHMEQEDVRWMISNKNKDCIFVGQSNNYVDLDSHINCYPDVGFFADDLELDDIMFEEEMNLGGFDRFMVIGK